MASKLVNPASSHMLVSEKEKRETKEKMKRNAATTTKFVPENVATNHFEKRKTIRKERTEKKEKERKRRKEQEERKQEKQNTWLILPVVICLSQRKKKNGNERKNETKRGTFRNNNEISS